MTSDGVFTRVDLENEGAVFFFWTFVIIIVVAYLINKWRDRE